MSSLAPSALAAAGLTALDILAPGAPQRSIGSIVAQITEEEHSEDRLTITRHPVERGANITDHAYREPSEVTIVVGWSNSSLAALGGSIDAALNAQSIGEAVGAFTSPTYVSDVYAKLLKLQQSLTPMTIVTGKRMYTNMLIESLSITTDVTTENALIATCHCRELILVQTQTTNVPSQSVQANPQATASPTSVGPVAPTPATTANRGAFATDAAQSPSVPMFQVPVAAPPLGPAPSTNILSGPL